MFTTVQTINATPTLLVAQSHQHGALGGGTDFGGFGRPFLFFQLCFIPVVYSGLLDVLIFPPCLPFCITTKLVPCGCLSAVGPPLDRIYINCR